MDAHAHLRGLGWRGTGYSLDKANRGLAKPLLVAHKFDSRGLGAKTQKQKQDDRWWLNAFDSALKNLSSGTESALAQVQRVGFNRGGLYGFFVRGEPLASTFSDSDIDHSSSSHTPQIAPLDETMPKNKAARAASRKSDKRKLNLEAEDEHGPTEKKTKIIGDIEDPVPKTLELQEEKPVLKNATGEEHKQLERGKSDKSQSGQRQHSSTNGTPNSDSVERKKKEQQVERMIKAEIKRRERAEEFGPILPSPAELLKMEKAAAKAGPERFHETDLAKLSIKVHGMPAPGQPYKKVKYKEEKIKRQKLLRQAERELKARKYHEAFGTPYVNEANMTPEERERHQKRGKETQKRARQEARRAKQDAEEQKKQEKEEKRAAKISRKQEKRERKKQAQEKNAEMKMTTQDVTVASKDQFANGMDEIKLGKTHDGKVRRVPGIGKVDKYPTKAEKRQRKVEAEATKLGISVEQYEESIKSRKPKDETIKSEILADEEVNATIKNDDTVASQMDIALSTKKLEKYTRKAAAKGISVEEYVRKKKSKGKKQDSDMSVSGAPAELVDTEPGPTLSKSGPGYQQEDQPSLNFVLDSTGNDDLLPSAFIVDTAGDTDILSRPVETLVWHPDMIGNRKVKELSKEERKARLEWMRERRLQRKLERGKATMSKTEQSKLRTKRKIQQRGRIVAGIMSSKGKLGPDKTKEELHEARRHAKRQMRNLKKERRNKMIHRKKPDANLGRVYGGQTTQR